MSESSKLSDNAKNSEFGKLDILGAEEGIQHQDWDEQGELASSPYDSKTNQAKDDQIKKVEQLWFYLVINHLD